MTETPPPFKRKKIMLSAIGGFVLLGAILFFYWLLYARFYEYTDDAYVNGNKVVLTSQISGIVTSFTADDTDFVEQGRILVELDKTDRQIALDKSIADLGGVVREVSKMFEKVPEIAAKIEKNKAHLLQCSQDFDHREALIDEGAVSIEDLEHAIAALNETFAELEASEHEYLAALSQIENTTIEDHPFVMSSKERVKEAYVNLKRCTLLAPVSGIVAQRNVQVGKQITWGEPLLAIVPLEQMWVEANFKEVQLSGVRIGQPTKIVSDLWGRDFIFHGTVVGIGGGTGSIFSVLPPQNATGNWIKIVQRLAVRIALDPQELKEHPLRLGLSMEVTVDIHDRDKKMIPPVKSEHALYETDVVSFQEEGVDALISQTIRDNLL